MPDTHIWWKADCTKLIVATTADCEEETVEDVHPALESASPLSLKQPSNRTTNVLYEKTASLLHLIKFWR